MSSGYKHLAKNMGALTLSSFATKILTFFLVPLYTSVLTTSEYGTFDLINSTVNLLIPVLTLNIAEAVLRFALDEDADQISIFTVGVRYTTASVVIIAAFAIVSVALNLFTDLFRWWPMFLLMYGCYAFGLVISNQARGLDNMKQVAVGGVLGSAATIALNIIFLLPLHMGLQGYFLAYIFGSLFQTAYLFISLRLWNFYSASRKCKDISKSMRDYGTPMMANSVAWWVNSVSDRYVVTWFCGVSENGIYAVGSKIPSILNALQTIFNQAWVLSAVHEFDPDDKDNFFIETYNAYGFIMVTACSALIVLDRPLAHFLYAADFYAAWKYVPFLLVGMVFGALSGHIGGVFAAVKNSKLYASSTSIGAIANVVMNVVLVPLIGALGSAIATAISYWIVWALRRRKMANYINVSISLVRDYSSYAVLLVQSVVILSIQVDSAFVYLLEISLFLVVLFLYREEARVWIQILGRGIGKLVSRN